MIKQVADYHDYIIIWKHSITEFQNKPNASNKRNVRIIGTDAGLTLNSIEGKVSSEQWDTLLKMWQDTYNRMVDTFKEFWWV